MNQQENNEHSIEKNQKGFQYKISLVIPVLILFFISPFLKLDQPVVRFLGFFFIFIPFVFTKVILEEKGYKISLAIIYATGASVLSTIPCLLISKIFF